MSSKYDLDRLLDPYGIKKFQKTISRITNPWKEYSAINTAIPSIPTMYESTALEAMRKAVVPSIPAMYDSTALEAMRKAVMPSIPAMYDSTALEAMRRAASSIAINKSLGLQADIQRLIAAKTLMPDLNAKIFNLHQKLYAIAGITEQRLNQNNFDSTHNYLDPFDEFNEKYNQDLHVGEAA
ncbi:hypothetical protein OHW11_18380, partial [Acinetobacter baumannii]|nr:hypothetical protein [Acinetobacter baumannii]